VIRARGRPAPLLAASWLFVASCAPEPSARTELRATAWPEADALFHADPRLRGADAAFSVPLGGERVLWLLGDTFVSTTPARIRRESRMVRNSVAVQTGLDPTRAAMSFHWRGTETEPSSFFPEDGEAWYWPQHGIVVDGTLVVFLARLRATPGVGLGFEAEGYRAAVIDDPSGPPDEWDVRVVSPLGAPTGLLPGAALVLEAEHVVALAIREPGDHAGFLVRWARADFAAGRLDASEWWTGAGWSAPAALDGLPARVIADAGPESSVHHDAARDRWMHVRSVGFGATEIGVSYAPAMRGPWSAAERVFRPEESDAPDAFVYAAKAHPELEGADLVVTYASNTFADFSVLLGDESLYYPRFVRFDWVPVP
jgi:hypothetical protein